MISTPRLLLVWALLLAGFVCLAQQTQTKAYWQTRDSNYNQNIASGGAAPTLTITDAQRNDACGFLTSCNITGGMTVNAGFVVVGTGAQTSGSTLSGVSVCLTALSQVVSTGVFATNYVWDLWAGTVACSGNQTVTVTATTANSLNWIYAGIGTFANLTSNTATSTCTGSNASFSGGVQACTTGTITIPASGFGICAGFQSTNSALTFVSPVSTDQSVLQTRAGAIGSAATAATITPSMNVSNFFQGALACGTWH